MLAKNITSVRVLTTTNAVVLGKSIAMHLLFCSQKDGQKGSQTEQRDTRRTIHIYTFWINMRKKKRGSIKMANKLETAKNLVHI